MHCAVALRLVFPWFGTGRLVIADAAFASLLTCTELLKRSLFFIGVLKGCTKGGVRVRARVRLDLL